MTPNIGSFNTNLGLSPVNMGARRDPAEERVINSFSRMMEESLREEQEALIPEGERPAESAPGPGIRSPGEVPVSTIPRQAHVDKTSELYEQCLALETFLVKNILTSMRKNVLKSSLIDTGFAGEIYEDMLWDEYSKEYTKNAGFGLAELAYLELTGQRGRRP